MKKINSKFVFKKKKDVFPPNLDYLYFENYKDHPFLPDAEDFSLVNSWWLAESSLLAYADEDFILNQINKMDFDSFRFFNSFRCKCFVVNTLDYAIVSFRGTAAKSFDFFIDWIDNLNIKMAEFKGGGSVHSGFYNAFKDIWNKETGFEEYLKSLKMKYPGIKFWFTGHSLGGAVAALAAASFKHCSSLYTFGAPKVGNPDFYKNLKIKIYRIVNYNDFIVYLPPSLNNKTKNDYTHQGEVKFINKNKKILNEIKYLENKFTKSIKMSSKIIDILFDKDKNIIMKIYDLNNRVNIENNSSPVTFIGRQLNKVKKILLKNRWISISNHAPILYVINLWNIYIKSISLK